MLEMETPMMDEVISGLGTWVDKDWIGSLNAALELEVHSCLLLFYGCDTKEGLLS